eukprot:gnl/TRDRNA2_/TRDRNA2_90737_c0_seq1.p1 gnl/TRDRNA2_/TRDRNA2_90737_c0~~gnl/TRDRNA2_/TRDRNA2_90737_c0_seq1.p1  ORF type:complete len:227 (-),score=45.11 gnl/TRDRNA2_/TRDRNA2_90737_c0_seq1:62-742(-)
MSDDEDHEALVPRQHALLGLKFSEAEDRELVRQVGSASVGMVVCSIFLFFVSIIHKGNVMHAFLHLLVSLSLPFIGYYGVKKESSRIIWFFHIGTVQFAIFHFVVAIVMLQLVISLEARPPASICANNGPRPPQLREPDPMSPQQAAFRECEDQVQEYQSHAPWLLFWWAVTTAPLWTFQMYAAYQAQEYYFRLRVRRLITRPGAAVGDSATVTEVAPDGEGNAVE